MKFKTDQRDKIPDKAQQQQKTIKKNNKHDKPNRLNYRNQKLDICPDTKNIKKINN